MQDYEVAVIFCLEIGWALSVIFVVFICICTLNLHLKVVFRFTILVHLCLSYNINAGQDLGALNYAIT